MRRTRNAPLAGEGSARSVREPQAGASPGRTSGASHGRRRWLALLTATLLGVTAAATRPAHAAEGKRAVAAATPRVYFGPWRTKVILADATAKPAKKAKEASCVVIEFHATKSGSKNVDAGLSKWKTELDQPPLSAFDTFKVTGQKTLSLAQGGTGNAKITASLGVLFKGTVTETEKDRLQLEITIDNATGKRMYRSNSTQDSGASQILSAGKSGDANVFFVLTCSAQ